MKLIKRIFPIGLLLWLSVLMAGCNSGTPPKEVVVYTSVDRHHAEPVLNTFEKLSGIRVQAVYDVEATKTTGLVNRLLAEKGHPRADVFWNGEFVQTLFLKEKGILAAYAPPPARGLHAAYQDTEHFWNAAGGRARTLLVNTDLVTPEDFPSGIQDLFDPRWPAKRVGLAYPLFGTTATHAAALYALWGEKKGRAFFQHLQQRGLLVVDGNSVVRDMVADGRLMWGLTDTDDAIGAVEKRFPVKIILPDQGADDVGTLVIPYTVALVAGGPHPQMGKKLIDFLLGEEAEAMLADSGFCQIRTYGTDKSKGIYAERDLKIMAPSFEQVRAQLEAAKKDLREIFLR